MGSYPSIVELSFGDEKVTSTAKIAGLPLGVTGILPDGRTFRHAKVSATTAVVVGKLYQGVAIAADTAYGKSLTIAAATVGATALVITAGSAVAIGTDEYADGYAICANSTGTGIGYLYKIKSCSSAAAGSASTVKLYENDSVKEAIAAGTSAGLRRNKYDGIVLTEAGTGLTGVLAGVPCASAAVNAYIWLQSKGPAAVFTGGTVLVSGEVVLASTAGGGAVVPALAGSGSYQSVKAGLNFIGYGMTSALVAGYAMVDLRLD